MSVIAESGAVQRPEGERKRARRLRKLLPLFAGLTVTAAILVIWHVASTSGWVSPVFLPPPAAIVAALGRLIQVGYVDSTLLQHVGASLGRVFSALFFSVLIGVPAGLVIATSPIGRGVLDPVVEFLRPLPPLAYLPLVIIWFGIGETSKVLVISLAMAPAIIISTAAGVRSASKNQVNAARAFGATPLQLLRHVLLPAAIPSILTGIRIALGAGWTTLVAAELVAAGRGLGYMIQSAAQFLVTDVVIAGILVISAIAFAFEALLRFVERRYVPWSRNP
ncbi:taurine transport system permease protein [Devosia sp. YR412]|uniref:ABC transporter permease subunit n=1 Tax=Devosia sp. YR412 TaxID=1881030 RepID=UPI0008B88F91|nr:ABC transporter permease subunit [Devosia sp. YR412]SEQ37202.1 taurine transport system permease protein [Devosia sp. YR412]